MDVSAFLKLRTKFIGDFYDNAVMGFLETQRRIESGEPPFDSPPYNESGEPPFLEDWSDAATSIEVIGRTAISMLSESLKVYFLEWDKLLRIQCGKRSEDYFKRGYWHGFRDCFTKACDIDWAECPADADFIEQIALARNSSQHGGRITSMAAEHPRNLRARFPNPIFVPDYEKNADDGGELHALMWLGSKLVVSRDALFEAIRQVEWLVDWLEPQLQKFRGTH